VYPAGVTTQNLRPSFLLEEGPKRIAPKGIFPGKEREKVLSWGQNVVLYAKKEKRWLSLGKKKKILVKKKGIKR